MGQYVGIGIAFRTHYGGTYLAKADAVAPAGSTQGEGHGSAVGSGLACFNHKCGAEEMACGECAAYLEFLANDKGLFAAYYAHAYKAAGGSALYGLEGENRAEIYS